MQLQLLPRLELLHRLRLPKPRQQCSRDSSRDHDSSSSGSNWALPRLGQPPSKQPRRPPNRQQNSSRARPLGLTSSPQPPRSNLHSTRAEPPSRLRSTRSDLLAAKRPPRANLPSIDPRGSLGWLRLGGATTGTERPPRSPWWPLGGRRVGLETRPARGWVLPVAERRLPRSKLPHADFWWSAANQKPEIIKS